MLAADPTAGERLILEISEASAMVMPDVVSVFILPPSMEELKRRLVRRAEDSEEVIARRLKNALEEIPHWQEYDYVVINDDLDRAFQEVKSVLVAERLRQDRRHGLYDFARTLTGSEK